MSEPDVARYSGLLIGADIDLGDIIPERYRHARLNDLPEGLRDVWAYLPRGAGIFLWGPPGTGKTHAMSAFVRELWLNGKDVARITYERLMLDIRDAFKPDSGLSEMDVIKPYLSVDALVIEDVGTSVGQGRQESDFSLRTFLVVLDTRLEHCLPTYITSNKPIEELAESFDSRVASRLTEACRVVRLEGRDKRREMIDRLSEPIATGSGPIPFDPNENPVEKH
jgi:DNA replication protein DnaC